MDVIFPPRRLDSHKGDYGKLFIVAGSLGMSGAAILAAKGAMRTGVGLLFLGVPRILNQIVETNLLEVISKPLPQTKDGSLSLQSYSFIYDFAARTDALVLGPGLSLNKQTQKLVRKLLSAIKIPLLIDADGLNAVGTNPNFLRQASVITPHLGEMGRLLKISPREVQKRKKEIARDFACKYKTTVILKGFETVVSSSEGKIYVNKSGNPGMATAGAGDVLAGMVGALLARGFSPFEAAKVGVYLHGCAGDLAAEEKGQESMLASDIIEKIPHAIKEIRDKF